MTQPAEQTDFRYFRDKDGYEWRFRQSQPYGYCLTPHGWTEMHVKIAEAERDWIETDATGQPLAKGEASAKEKPLACEGSCEERGGHRGEVRPVQVRSGRMPWGEFSYCEAAIEEDRSRGLTVTVAAEPTPAAPGGEQSESIAPDTNYCSRCGGMVGVWRSDQPKCLCEEEPSPPAGGVTIRGARGLWDGSGEPTNLMAAAEDALAWLDFFQSKNIPQIGAGNMKKLADCAEALRRHLCLLKPEEAGDRQPRAPEDVDALASHYGPHMDAIIYGSLTRDFTQRDWLVLAAAATDQAS